MIKDKALDKLQTLVQATVGGAVPDATSGAGHAERRTRQRRGAREKGRARDAVGDMGVKHETGTGAASEPFNALKRTGTGWGDEDRDDKTGKGERMGLLGDKDSDVYSDNGLMKTRIRG